MDRLEEIKKETERLMTQLKCPCDKCSEWESKNMRCKTYSRSMDCITYCNWYSETFKEQ